MAEKDTKGESEKLDTKALQEALSNLPKAVQEAVIKGIKDTVAENNRMRAQQEEDLEDDDEDDDDEEADNIDLERLSRKDLVKHMEDRFGKAFEKALKPLRKEMESVSSSREKDALVQAFKETKAKYKDFDDWKDEITAVAKGNPTLAPEQMYLLARAQNPDKAKEIDQKLETAKADQEKSQKTPFGGLTPTSGKSVEGESGKMDRKDAANKAWDDAMAQVPPEMIGADG